jgi:DNA-binding CsgD family transcriptional regulator
MYRVALIGDRTKMLDRLERCVRTLFSKLIELRGPYPDAVAARDEDGFDGYLAIEAATLGDLPTENIRLENSTGQSATLAGDNTPVRIVVALLALIEGFQISGERKTNGGESELLTPREIEVLELVSGGYNNGEIAGYLDITERTVKYHVSEILRKLDVSGRTEAVVEAARSGIITL